MSPWLEAELEERFAGHGYDSDLERAAAEAAADRRAAQEQAALEVGRRRLTPG